MIGLNAQTNLSLSDEELMEVNSWHSNWMLCEADLKDCEESNLLNNVTWGACGVVVGIIIGLIISP